MNEHPQSIEKYEELFMKITDLLNGESSALAIPLILNILIQVLLLNPDKTSAIAHFDEVERLLAQGRSTIQTSH